MSPRTLTRRVGAGVGALSMRSRPLWLRRARQTKGRRERRVLIIVENLPVPFDRRVWQEATALRDAGYQVSVICPKSRDYRLSHEVVDGIEVYRHPLPHQATNWYGYLAEYAWALAWAFGLAWRVHFTRGFDVIHACNPPDAIFLVGGFFKVVLRKRFLFDHHDLSPELYVAKGGRAGGFLHRVLTQLERLTYRTADAAITTNDSYRRVALDRGGMQPERVFVVRSGPDLSRVRRLPPDPALKNGRRYLVTYVGIMGAQDGVDLLLEAARCLVYDLGRSDTQFLLVGGGTELERMRALSEELGLTDYVTFTGLQPPDSDLLWTALSTCDVGVSPDPPNEMNDHSTMNKVLEYMTFAKPVVQFDLTEGRASAGAASLYARGADPRDLARKVEVLLDDEGMRTRMGAIGRQRIETMLGWEHQKPALFAAYEAALGERARAPRMVEPPAAPVQARGR